MLVVQMGNSNIELATTLGVAKAIEARFKNSLKNVVQNVETMDISELIDIIVIATKEKDKQKQEEVRELVFDNFDYTDLLLCVIEVCRNLMFSGTSEKTEAKIDKLAGDENGKNALRAMMNLPLIKTEA